MLYLLSYIPTLVPLVEGAAFETVSFFLPFLLDLLKLSVLTWLQLIQG